jgi:hypothetical protein
VLGFFFIRSLRHLNGRTLSPFPAEAEQIDEPGASRHKDFKSLAIALSRDEALSSALKDDFFAVADYVVVEDPAVNSYLMGREVNIRGRICKH